MPLRSMPNPPMLRLVLAALAAMLATVAAAQDNYPDKTVRILVNSPGGNPDLLARLLAKRLSGTFKQPFVVEDMPGAGGSLVARYVAGAPPDGSTLLLGDSGTLAINPAIRSKLGYDALRDFVPITGLADVPTVLIVPPSLPVQSLEDFVALAKAKPGALNIGSPGVGSIHHFTHEVFAERAGIRLQHVPFRTASDMVSNILTGTVQAGWSGLPNVLPLLDTGKLRVLCISTPERSAAAPQVPPCAEKGYPGFNVAARIGLLGPAKLSAAIVTKLQREAAIALREPEVADRMSGLGMLMQEHGTAQYVQFVKDDVERYATLAKRLGIAIQD